MNKKFKKQLFDFMSLTANDTEGELWIYGDIVDDKWYDTDVTPKVIRDALDEMGNVGTLNLRINSYGGSCVAGNAIVNLIDNYKRKTGAKVHAYIEGIAASMGSGVPMVADYIYMASNAMFMVHKPYSVAFGNSDDMEKEAEVLKKTEDCLVNNYMRHFNGTEDEIRQLMADETWLTADEALEYGLCDEILEPVAVAASANGIRINGKEFAENKLKEKFKDYEGRNQNMFVYDNSLMDFGIDEEKFKTLNLDAEVIKNICNAIKIPTTDSENEYSEELSEYGIDEETFKTTHTSADAVKTIAETSYNLAVSKIMDKAKETGIEVDNVEAILNLAKAGSEMDPEADTKAKSYDKLVNTAIENALKSGIKAKGNDFNDAKWKKILNSLDYEEILDQKNEWEAEAKLVLKAGKKVSVSGEQENPADDKSAVNPDDYNFTK